MQPPGSGAMLRCFDIVEHFKLAKKEVAGASLDSLLRWAGVGSMFPRMAIQAVVRSTVQHGLDGDLAF